MDWFLYDADLRHERVIIISVFVDNFDRCIVIEPGLMAFNFVAILFVVYVGAMILLKLSIRNLQRSRTL